jgi:hypothetical protein
MGTAKKRRTAAGRAAAAAAENGNVALGGITGVLEVPSKGAFDVEVWLVHDNPKWSVALGGTTDEGDPFEREIGADAPHFATSVKGVPDGDYLMTIAATLQDPGAQFSLVATSTRDRERVDLRPIAGVPTRLAILPVRVG